MMRLTVDTHSIADYETFLRVKSLPTYRVCGRTLEFPDEYASELGLSAVAKADAEYKPLAGQFDYQRDIAALAIRKRRFSVFADCGLGKTLIFLEFARHCRHIMPDKVTLIVSPLMVVPQTVEEAQRFYGDSLPIETVEARSLAARLHGRGGLCITNYDALTDDLRPGNLGAMILDESSMLKSHYGKWGTTCLRLGRGLSHKLACTGTPAPNDRIEYANHAVFMDAFPNANSFLSRFFVNRGMTGERWELKPHALEPFYRALSHWCIFLSNPATYGWKDNATPLPPIHSHIHRIDLTDEQEALIYTTTGELFANRVGGINSRSTVARIGKGIHNGERIASHKPEFIRRLVDSWPDESTIVWCLYNAEQDMMEQVFPEAASLRGETPVAERLLAIADFKAGRRRILISKPKILGFGLNLQVCTRQVFSGLQDSYEAYYQCVKRSNRVGSTRPLNVHIPVTDAEWPMIQTVLEKAGRVQADTVYQEKLFARNAILPV